MLSAIDGAKVSMLLVMPCVTIVTSALDLLSTHSGRTLWRPSLEREPVEGMYPDDELVVFFDNGNSWKGGNYAALSSPWIAPRP